MSTPASNEPRRCIECFEPIEGPGIRRCEACEEHLRWELEDAEAYADPDEEFTMDELRDLFDR